MHNDEIYDAITNALQNSFHSSVIFHHIDDDNSVIEMDYVQITEAILNKIEELSYQIIKK